jgi:hypothetical protein
MQKVHHLLSSYQNTFFGHYGDIFHTFIKLPILQENIQKRKKLTKFVFSKRLNTNVDLAYKKTMNCINVMKLKNILESISLKLDANGRIKLV